MRRPSSAKQARRAIVSLSSMRSKYLARCSSDVNDKCQVRRSRLDKCLPCLRRTGRGSNPHRLKSSSLGNRTPGVCQLHQRGSPVGCLPRAHCRSRDSQYEPRLAPKVRTSGSKASGFSLQELVTTNKKLLKNKVFPNFLKTTTFVN